MDNERPFVIESPTRIRLSPTAKAWAQTWGLSLTELGKYLLQQEEMRQRGHIQRDGET
jgi:hypothetical protein